MTTKDFVYLGLLLLTALAFYCNGFYSGVCRSKRVYETLLNDAQQDTEGSGEESEESFAHQASAEESTFSLAAARGTKLVTASRKELRGDFGPN